MAHTGGVLVVGEAAANGALRPVSWELLTAARTLADALGGPVTAVVAGVDGAAAQTWASAGADRLLLAEELFGDAHAFRQLARHRLVIRGKAERVETDIQRHVKHHAEDEGEHHPPL